LLKKQSTSSLGCHATYLTSWECSMSTPMHSKSASGWAKSRVSEQRGNGEIKLHTFPYPDSFVATTARKVSAGCRPSNALAFGLVALKDTHALPFTRCAFIVFVLTITLPDTDVRIERCRSERRPGRRPGKTAHGFGVPSRDGGVKQEARRRASSIVVDTDRLIGGASRYQGFSWIP
jgi:hypothetical protein